jgi:hypothetical protein
MQALMDLAPAERAARPLFWLSTRTRTWYFPTFDGEALDLLPRVEQIGSQFLERSGWRSEVLWNCSLKFSCGSEMPDENGYVNKKFNTEAVYIWRVGNDLVSKLLL